VQKSCFSEKCDPENSDKAAEPSGVRPRLNRIHVTLRKEHPVGSTSDKAKGMANDAAGNVKQSVGKATENESLEAEGFAQERKGEAQRAVGEAKDTVKNSIDKV
jgi:uncharacterized protein YjbJ (UPF0337 family)